MPPEGRMLVAAFLGLFCAGFAAGSFNTARHDYRWRDATVVRGVLVKNGRAYHYEYRPKGQPAVVGAAFFDQSSNQPDGVIDDWARLEYDPQLPEKLRRHISRGRAATNYRQFVITASVGSVFAAGFVLCVWSFLHAWYDKQHAPSI